MIRLNTKTGYIPGIIGRVAELHARYYSENWNFGHVFEAKVATELSSFIKNYDDSCDRIWSLILNDEIEGSITIIGSSTEGKVAHLRWFIISEKLRGKGAGNFLMKQALSFCREVEFERIYLWTFQGLISAHHIYEKYGFQLTEENPGNSWGITVTEQRFELIL